MLVNEIGKEVFAIITNVYIINKSILVMLDIKHDGALIVIGFNDNRVTIEICNVSSVVIIMSKRQIDIKYNST